MDDLTIVMPVYNEQEIIQQVIKDWCLCLRKLGINFQISAYNDGSKDNSLKKIQEIQSSVPELKIIDKPNSGHGPTILQGYQNASTEWIFQTDSDNEMKPDHFQQLWFKREYYDFLIGIRENRKQPFSRKVISLFSRLTVKIFFGRGVIDVNSPYRLMRHKAFQEIFSSIPAKTFAPNIIVSGMAAKKKFKIYETKVPIKFRTTGEVSIKKIKLLRAAIKAWVQTIRYLFGEK